MTIFLTLGDGDFSYSLDLVQYLSASSTTKNRVVVTGVDSLKDMQDKYKDCEYLLRQLRSTAKENLSVDVRHEVNAVSSKDKTSIEADVVVFNHPHLGIEDAARHGRFLHHFLDECNKSWLSNNGQEGTVHLTLAAGQWERWHGQKSASKQGFLLTHRLPFLPPPVEDAKYQHRRHQTGKSFHNRTTGSETFVLVRKKDAKAYLFAWQSDKEDLNQSSSVPQFACLSCDRTFREERSLKSHMKGVHDESKKRKRREESKCPHCEVQGIVKIFSHEQGLTDHVQAKHAGLHTATIRPDWAKTEEPAANLAHTHGRCEVCEYVYQDPDDVIWHAEEFLPTQASVPCQSFACQFCVKAFHDQRAQLQHENFCKQRQKLPPPVPVESSTSQADRYVVS
jgi:hypothetical protein